MDYKKLSKKTFDRQAAYYDQKATISVSKFPKISYSFVLEEVKKENPKRILDLGCGTGELARLLRQENKTVEIEGIDLSPKMVEQAKYKKIPLAFFREGDAECLPYDNEFFDMAVCVQSFHHYPNPQKALEEVLRVLKPEGTFVLCDMYVANPVFRWLENRFLLKMLHLGDVHTYGREEICGLFETMGFQNIMWKRVHKVIFLCKAKKL